MLEHVLNTASDELARELTTMLNDFEQQLFRLADHARSPALQSEHMLSLRTLRVFARRWREVVLYLQLLIGLRAGKSAYQLEAEQLDLRRWHPGRGALQADQERRAGAPER